MSILLGQAHEQIASIVSRAEEVAEEVEKYLDEATRIDAVTYAIDSRDHIPLYGSPYGGGRVRLAAAPGKLRVLIAELEALRPDEIPVGKLSDMLDSAIEQVEELKDTMKDCTPLPSK